MVAPFPPRRLMFEASSSDGLHGPALLSLQIAEHMLTWTFSQPLGWHRHLILLTEFLRQLPILTSAGVNDRGHELNGPILARDGQRRWWDRQRWHGVHT